MGLQAGKLFSVKIYIIDEENKLSITILYNTFIIMF